MTRSDDLDDLIAEHAANPAEGKNLEQLAGKLGDQLGKDVPFRPEFKAELRKRLMAEARRQVTPWYRRPAVVGGTFGVAAAAAVLVIGLNLVNSQQQKSQTQAPAPVAEAPGPVGPRATQFQPTLVAKTDLPVVQLPDEKLSLDLTGPETTTGDVTTLKAMRLTVRATDKDVAAIAGGIGLTASVKPVANGWEVAQGTQRLTVTPDGKVTFTDSGAGATRGTPTGDIEGARVVARRFLDRANLPVPDRAPSVTENTEAGAKIYTVVFIQRIDSQPVVNAPVVVRVTDFSGVVGAEAYVSASSEEIGPFEAIPAGDAVKSAQAQGGATFSDSDLVWVRTVKDSVVNLQPYWRIFGTDPAGGRLARYVPALKR